MYKYLLAKLLHYLSDNSGMAGLRLDQVDAYRKDMYKFEREGVKEEDTMYNKIYKVVSEEILWI